LQSAHILLASQKSWKSDYDKKFVKRFYFAFVFILFSLMLMADVFNVSDDAFTVIMYVLNAT